MKMLSWKQWWLLRSIAESPWRTARWHAGRAPRQLYQTMVALHVVIYRMRLAGIIHAYVPADDRGLVITPKGRRLLARMRGVYNDS